MVRLADTSEPALLPLLAASVHAPAVAPHAPSASASANAQALSGSETTTDAAAPEPDAIEGDEALERRAILARVGRAGEEEHGVGGGAAAEVDDRDRRVSCTYSRALLQE